MKDKTAILFAAAEVFPLVKTGGLADVIAALPPALRQMGANQGANPADVRLVVPGYPAVLEGVQEQRVVGEIGAMFGAARITLRLGVMPETQIPCYVVDAPFLYRRTGNPYHCPDGNEWPDNLQRFALLGWVAAHIASGELDPEWSAQILHAHDWHAALACAYLAHHAGNAGAAAHGVKTVFTVHNLAYQGLFELNDFHLLNLPNRFIREKGMEFYGRFSFMKAGLKFAQRVTTVSPQYAQEIATPEFGCGLDGVIRARGKAVSGILNGVDGQLWNPAADALIAAPYTLEKLDGKKTCKAALQQELGLESNPNAPVLSVISRLTPQKGLDLLLTLLPDLLHHHHCVQLAIQGNGDAHLEAQFMALANEFPQRVAVRLRYDESLAHRIMAGADAILVPSRFEPCGLTQLYGLRYGTIPVVRQVGGLADTVKDGMTGFVFTDTTPHALREALDRALYTYTTQSLQWQQMQKNGMVQIFSWDAAASQYMALYRELIY